MNKFEYKNLTPFKWFVLENFPFIEADFDALTNWQIYCKLGGEINKVIESMNLAGEQVEELTNFVNNYFDNLDVQDEINKKLDEMAESGTLGNLVDDLFDDYKKNINTIINAQNQNINEFENSTNSTLNSQNNLIDSINAKVNSSVSGTPIPVDSIKKMTNVNKIYLLTTNGNWYYNNGTEWVSGGVYQATAIDDNSINSSNIINCNFEKVTSSNYNLSMFVPNANIYPINPTLITLTQLSDNSLSMIKQNTSSAGFFFYVPSSFYDKYEKILFKFNFENYDFKSNIQFRHYNPDRFIGNIIPGSSYMLFTKKPNEVSSEYRSTFSLVVPNLGSGILKGIQAYGFNGELSIDPSSNLSTFINNYKEKIKFKDINNELNDINYNSISYWNFLNTDSNNTLQILNKNTIKLTSGNTIQNIGFVCNNETKTSGNLIVKGHASNNCDLYILDNDNHLILISNIHSGDFNVSIDINNLVVHHNLTTPYKLLFSIGKNQTVTITNLKTGFNNLMQYSDYNNNLESLLFNLLSKTSLLQSQINNLESSLKNYELIAPNGKKYKIIVDNNGDLSTEPIEFNKVLYIGNSLLLGFGTHGMASYDISTDYYAKLNNLLSAKVENYSSDRISGVPIETGTNINDVDDYINNNIINKLSNDTDLVIIQLGDNTSNNSQALSLFETSANHLINAIKNISPSAKIVWVGTWYNIGIMLPIINSIVQNNNISFINISGLNIPSNCSSVGSEYIDSNNQVKTITSEGVASHPGNAGHLAIANLINNSL